MHLKDFIVTCPKCGGGLTIEANDIAEAISLAERGELTYFCAWCSVHALLPSDSQSGMVKRLKEYLDS